LMLQKYIWMLHMFALTLKYFQVFYKYFRRIFAAGEQRSVPV
jgi:hypothetical protein